MPADKQPASFYVAEVSSPKNNGLLAGLLLAALATIAGVGTLLPIATKGPQGVTILYLSEFAHIYPVTAVPLTLFVVAPAAMTLGLLLATGLVRTSRPGFMILGLLGLLFTTLGVMEGIEHIRSFINGCSAINFAADDTSPIGVGWGGMLAIAGYGGMVLSAMLTVHNQPAGSTGLRCDPAP